MRTDITDRIVRMAGNHSGALIVLTKLARFSLSTLDDVEAMRLSPSELWAAFERCDRSLLRLVAHLSSRDPKQMRAGQ